MKKLYIISLLSAIILYACKSEFGRFNDDALTFASNDKRIIQKEYESLVEQIKLSEEKGFQNLKSVDGKIDNNKVVAYLLKYYSAKKLALTSADIWQPETVNTKADKFNINVFLENSESIDGYVGDNSSFKTTIFKLLTDLKNFSSAGSLNLNYINTKPIPIKVSASRDDIHDFYERLNPTAFKSAGGTRGSTDIEKMLKQLLDNSNSKNLSVFISDCVFSPGKNDAKKYLDGQYASIYNDFRNALKINPDLSIIILQCTAKFEGTYYDCYNKEHKNINAERPYYIWFIGTSEQIKSLVDYKIFDLIKSGYKNKLVIQAINNVSRPNFKIQIKPRIGEFNSKSLAQGIITGSSKSKENKNKGLFGFNVAVDFSKSLQDPNYFQDTANYELSDKNYSLKIAPITDKTDISLNGFTHILRLQTTQLKNENLRINIVGKTPSWAYTSTSGDDTKIETDPSQNLKTFGIAFLISAVCDAYYPKSKSNEIQSISIQVDIAKTSFSWLWIVILFILIGIIIYTVNKKSKT
jgi:hypothetical protein